MTTRQPDPVLRVLEELETRIRGQADLVPFLSGPWRAHMADLAHVESVRMAHQKKVKA